MLGFIGLCHQAKDMVLRFSDIITPAWTSLKCIAWVLLLCLYCFSQQWDDWLKMSPTFKKSCEELSHFRNNRPFMEKLQLCSRILLKQGLCLPQAGLKLAVLLPQPPWCLGYMGALVFSMPGRILISRAWVATSSVWEMVTSALKHAGMNRDSVVQVQVATLSLLTRSASSDGLLSLL